MRLIDADAMKADVKAQTQILKLMFKDDEDGLKLADIMYEGYMAQIDKMPTIEPERQWVPCSERLPKRNGRYLVSWGHQYATGVDTAQWDGFDWYSEQDVCMTDDVLTWMPLPEPWKGQNG